MSSAFARRFLMALLAVLLSSSVPTSSSPTRTGETFPAFTLTSFDGRTTNTADFRGRILVLNVWATWCAACRQEMASLQRLSEALDREGVSVIGVSVDSDLFRAREYVRANGFGFARFIDPDMRLLRQVADINALPSTFVIRPDGRLAQQTVGARNWLGTPALAYRKDPH